MENINIYINKKTRQVNLSKSVIGNDGENLQENLVFFFDEFVDGTARLEIVKQNVAPSYIMLTKVDNTYQLPIKSIITKGGRINMQLVITEGTDDEEIPVFKSNQFYLIVNSSINAEIEEEEEYPQWIDVANTKLNELDSAIEEASNLNIEMSKSGTTTTVTLTDKDGETSSVSILDGAKGDTGLAGSDGITPTIGNNGNWYLGETDTGKPSRGIQGETGQSGLDGADGISPTVTTSKSGTTTTITITDKNGDHTATINDGTDGTDGRDGYIQYTAGDNITIENNVISATGGSEYSPTNKLNADYIDDSTSTNQMYYVGKFSDLNTNNNLNFKLGRKGIYLPDRASGYASYISKLTNNNLTSTLDYSLMLIFITKDISTMTQAPSSKTYFAYALANSKSDGICYFLKFYINTAANIMIETNVWSNGGSNIEITENAQTINGIKTFSSIPNVSSYTAPTTDTQLVAKKYVDDKIGDINTILASLTTPGGNS